MRMLSQVHRNSESISDLILDELLDDTAQEMLLRRVDAEAETEAHCLRNAPNVRDILYRLQEMEVG